MTYRVEAQFRDDEHGCTSYLVMGGQKRYLCQWDTGQIDWSWVLNEKAKRVPPETLYVAVPE